MSASNNLPNATPHANLDDLLEEVGTANTEELLGAGAQTSLGVAMVQATVLTLALLGVFTFGPRLWGTPSNDQTKADKGKNTDAVVSEDSAKKPAAPAVTPDKGKTADAGKPPVTKEALDKLGVNDSKSADPKVNPLDKGPADPLDKILDK